MTSANEQFYKSLIDYSEAMALECTRESDLAVRSISEVLETLLKDTDRIGKMSADTLAAIQSIESVIQNAVEQPSKSSLQGMIKVLAGVVKEHKNVNDVIMPVIEALQFQDALRQQLENMIKVMKIWSETRGRTSAMAMEQLFGEKILKCTTMQSERDLIRKYIANLPEEKAADSVMLFLASGFPRWLQVKVFASVFRCSCKVTEEDRRHETMPYFCEVFAIIAGIAFSNVSHAGISIEPFASVSSTKTIKPDKAGKNKSDPATTETAVTKQRTTYGLRASIGFFRIMKFQLGVGQNQLTTTSKVSQAVDDYGEIDFEKDLDMDTSNPASDVKVTETQKKGTATLVLDPSFSIFVLRAKAGVVATQREFSKEQEGTPAVAYVSPIKYKPTLELELVSSSVRACISLQNTVFSFTSSPRSRHLSVKSQ